MGLAQPRDRAQSNPRDLLRRGLAESHRGEIVALQTLAAALEGLRAAGDASGVIVAAAARVVTAQAHTHYRQLRESAADAAAALDPGWTFASRDDELLALSGGLCRSVLFEPSDRRLDACVTRMLELLELDVEVNLRFAAARLILYYAEPRENRELSQRVFGLIVPWYDDPTLTSHRLGRWLAIWMQSTTFAKDPSQHARAREKVQALADRADPEVRFILTVTEFDEAARARDVARIERALAAIEPICDPANLHQMGRLAWLRGRCELVRGDADAALFHATRARRYAEEQDVPPPMMGVRYALEAQARLLAGDFDGARSLFERTAAMVAILHAEEMRDMVRMVDAYQALVEQRDDARDKLALAFAAPRKRQFYDTFDTSPTFGAMMCAHALDQDVEPEFVKRIISLHNLAPPPNAGPAWPWPIRIHALGTFELVRDGTAMTVRGKAQRKPSDLLKALIAAGGRKVDKSRLADWLWPDAEPAAAIASLDMAISRLRKMLGIADAIRIEDGKVDLDRERLWVDVFAFDADVEALQQALRTTAATDDRAVERLGGSILARYRGAFLENDEPQRWLLATRDRLRSRFLRSVTDAGRHWERRERWPAAIELYERGIETDTLAEDLYRSLMRCHLALGQPAEAARVYRRCREMLSVQLGIAPSADTEGLFKSIYGTR